MRDRNIVIVGAGPVGLVTALLLARWGVPTIVLEKSGARQAIGSRAICFQRDVLDILDRVGVADQVVARGITWTTGRTFYRQHEVSLTTFPEPLGAAYPPWLNISQSELEGYLLERVEQSPLIDVRFDHEVVDVRDIQAGVEIVGSTPRGERLMYGSYVVGADGGHSVVRQRAGIGFPGRSFDDRFLICDVRAILPFPRERRFYFDPDWNPGRQVLVHEQPDHIWRIDWQVPADFDLDRARASGDLDLWIKRVVGDTEYELSWASVYRFHQRCADRFRVGRLFLVGDAAHVYAPFGARGLNSGIQDAENLAWKLAYVSHGWVGDAAVTTLLDSYEHERRAAALENLRVTGATMEFLAPQTEEQWAVRRAVLARAVWDPQARRLINSGKLAEPYWYLDSPLTTPGDGLTDFPTGPGVARPPVAGVLCPDGACRVDDSETRLRRLFGSGFVILVSGRNRQAISAEIGSAGTSAPVTVYALTDLDPSGELAAALAASDDSVHLIRPDGHIAAVLREYDPGALAAAIRRAAGWSVPDDHG